MKTPHDFQSNNKQNQFLKTLNKVMKYFSLFSKWLVVLFWKLLPVWLMLSIILFIMGVVFFILTLFSETSIHPLISLVNSSTVFPTLPEVQSLDLSLTSLSQWKSNGEKLSTNYNALALVPTFSQFCSYKTIGNDLTQDQKNNIEHLLNTKIPLAFNDDLLLPFEKKGNIALSLWDSYLFDKQDFLFKQWDKWYLQGLQKDPLFKSTNEKYKKSFDEFMENYCWENTLKTLSENFVYSQKGLLTSQGLKVAEEHKSWLYQTPKPNKDKAYQENFQLNVLKELSKVKVLKAFVSWKYYLTKTNTSYNEYTTDPMYEYLLISNPFQEANITATIKDYDSLNELFLSFNETLIDKTEDENNTTPQEIDITKKAIELGYTGVSPIKVFAYKESSLNDFFDKLSIAISKEKINIEKHFKGYNAKPQELKVCLVDPIQVNNWFWILNKGYKGAYYFKNYFKLCYTLQNIYLRENLEIGKNGELKLTWVKESIAKAKTIKVKLSITPYFSEGEGQPNLKKSEIFASNILQQLQLKLYELPIVEKEETNEEEIIGKEELKENETEKTEEQVEEKKEEVKEKKEETNIDEEWLYQLLKGNFFLESWTEKLSYLYEHKDLKWKNVLHNEYQNQLRKWDLANQLLFTNFSQYLHNIEEEKALLEKQWNSKYQDVLQQLIRDDSEQENIEEKAQKDTLELFPKQYYIPKANKKLLVKKLKSVEKAKKQLWVEFEKEKYDILHPYIQKQPLIQEEYNKISETSINPILTLFSPVPETTSVEEFVSMEKAFNSFFLYSNANENSFFNPLKTNETLDIEIKEWMKENKGEKNVFFKSSYWAFPQALEKKKDYDWLLKFLAPSLHKNENWNTENIENIVDFMKSKKFQNYQKIITKKIDTFSKEELGDKISLRKIWKIWTIEALYDIVWNDWERFVNLLELRTDEAKQWAKIFFRDMQTYDLNAKNNKFETFQTELVQDQDLKFLTLYRYYLKSNTLNQLFENYYYDYQTLQELDIPWLYNLAILRQFISPLSNVLDEESLTLQQRAKIRQEQYDFTIMKRDFNKKLEFLLEEIEHNKKMKELFNRFSSLNIEKQVDEINEKLLSDSYAFWEAFRLKHLSLLEKFIKQNHLYMHNANEYFALNGEEYLSIIGYNYFTYEQEKEHFETIKSTLKWMREASNSVSDEAIKKIEWDWFKMGLDEIACEEWSECEEVIKAIKKRNNWWEFKTYINQLVGELKINLKNTQAEREVDFWEAKEVEEGYKDKKERIKEILDTIKALEDLLDSYLHFANQAQINDVWDIVDFWSDDVFACDKQGWTPEEIRQCKLLKVRYGRFNLSNYWGSPNGLTGQCVRWANMLNKFFNKGLSSCRYSLNGWDQWASYWGLQYGLYNGMHVGRFPVSRWAANCTQGTIYHAKKTFGGYSDALPRFCPVIWSRENLQQGKIKNNMIAVAYGAWWWVYGHVVYIGWVDNAQGKVWVAEMNYKHNLAWGWGIDSLTVRQSLQPVEKFKLYFDLDKPFSLEELKNKMGLSSIAQVNNEVIANYCQNYEIFNS